MSHEAFPIYIDHSCDFCSQYDITYPAGLDKYNVLSREQYYAAMVRLDDAYSPS